MQATAVMRGQEPFAETVGGRLASERGDFWGVSGSRFSGDIQRLGILGHVLQPIAQLREPVVFIAEGSMSEPADR